MLTHIHFTTEQVNALRQRYAVGTQIRCLKMNDPFAPIEPNTLGTVSHIDDMGQIHMSWENRRTLALIPGIDHFVIEGKETLSVTIQPIADNERKALEDTGLVLDNYVKVIVMDIEGHSSYMYLKEQEYKMYGYEYICDHVSLEYIDALEDWYVQLDVNPYYNDPVHFPPKTIVVERYGRYDANCEEIYRCPETKKYYIRQIANNQNFARWLTAHKSQGCIEDDFEVRANITFVCGKEHEKVTFNSWNGNAAYSDTFNPNFGK